MDHFYTLIARCEFITNIARPVGRTIIDYDDLKMTVSLADNAFKRLGKIRPDVVEIMITLISPDPIIGL